MIYFRIFKLNLKQGKTKADSYYERKTKQIKLLSKYLLLILVEWLVYDLLRL